jgi:hypothetical protein
MKEFTMTVNDKPERLRAPRGTPSFPAAERKGTAFTAFAFAIAATAAAMLMMPMGAIAQEADAGARLESDLQKARTDLAQSKKDVAKADAELRKTDSLLHDEASRASQSEDRLAKDRERREKENQDLQGRLRETQAKIDAERASQNRRQNSVEEIKARQKSLTLTLAGFCDSLAARINKGLPWDNEPRLDRVLALKKDLEGGNATIDEGFARYNAVAKEEIKAGDEIALFNKPVTRKNGDVVNAQVLKIGNQWLVYMDEDGKRFGILERKASPSAPSGWAWDWREDPGFAEKNQIRAALEVKSAKRPPQLVVLGLGIAANASGNTGATSQPVPAAAAPVKGGK